MAQKRLTDLMRDRIAVKIREHTFAKRNEERNATSAALADRVYHGLYSDAELDLINSAPDFFFKCRPEIRANAGGFVVDLTFGNGSERRLVARDAGQYDRIDITDQILIDDIQTFAHSNERLAEEKKKLQRSVRSFLSSITTVEKLVAAMPEMVEPISQAITMPVAAPTSLVPTAAEIMCSIAAVRGEQREGCPIIEPVAA